MNKTYPVISPNSVTMLAVKSMNQTHLEEIDLVNNLAELLQSQADEAEIDRLFMEWVEHTRQHFSRENQLMQQYGFPAYPIHSQEHANVLMDLEQQYQDWQKNKDKQALEQYLMQTWPNWFHQHVNSMDYVTAQFLSQFIEN